ncbi:TIGR02569 family protein [Hoyosella rhizosphaerae]|uniref:TIGR02569 family protein n=1 Tax=Hoyosella rhizosphaerae TaxID=1755582 RepID=A0A916UBS5_9ACTN|nr:TIGR02569 family protein [Hoyosella rhizosphaerae]MBN4925968.1 TIGR02569 family protein [Hoyosella rhizosphaerae]GGC66566.1 TIGR02569 family protein [Hoyosella rhizosphaerae]
MSSVPPPEHVRSTFGLREIEPVSLGDDWDGGWRLNNVVLSPVGDHARAAWSAKVRESLSVDGARVAKPVRATDGRYVVSGWRADAYMEGSPEPRHDEVVSLSVRLHAALARLEKPRFITQPPVAPFSDIDVFVAADRAAWEPVPLRDPRRTGLLDMSKPEIEKSLDLLKHLGEQRKPVNLPGQLVHGDLFGTVLFAQTEAPGITDINPYWRPVPWAAAVVVVDSLSWGGADEGLIERWDAMQEWPQMLLRALMFRVAVHALHPRSTSSALTGLERTAEQVLMLL